MFCLWNYLDWFKAPGLVLPGCVRAWKQLLWQTEAASGAVRSNERWEPGGPWGGSLPSGRFSGVRVCVFWERQCVGRDAAIPVWLRRWCIRVFSCRLLCQRSAVMGPGEIPKSFRLCPVMGQSEVELPWRYGSGWGRGSPALEGYGSGSCISPPRSRGLFLVQTSSAHVLG